MFEFAADLVGRQGHLPGTTIRHHRRQLCARRGHFEAVHHQLQRAGADEEIPGRRAATGGARGAKGVAGRDRDFQPEAAQGQMISKDLFGMQ